MPQGLWFGRFGRLGEITFQRHPYEVFMRRVFSMCVAALGLAVSPIAASSASAAAPASPGPPTVALSGPVRVDESQSAKVTVLLAHAQRRTVSATLNVQNGSAINGQDFSVGQLQVEFAPGVVAVEVTIPIIDDRILEADESFDVVLAFVSGRTGNPRRTQVTISDNDSVSLPVSLTVPPISLVGTTPQEIEVTTLLADGSITQDTTGYRFEPVDLSILSISFDGRTGSLTGTAPGTTSIRVTAPNGVSAVGVVTVTDVVTGVFFETATQNPLNPNATVVTDRVWSDVPFTVRFYEATVFGRRNPVTVPITRDGTGTGPRATLLINNGAIASSRSTDVFSQPGQWVVTPRLTEVNPVPVTLTIVFTYGSFTYGQSRPARYLIAGIGYPESRVGETFVVDVYSLNNLVISEVITDWSVRESSDPASPISPVASISAAPGSRGDVLTFQPGVAYIHFTYGAYSGAFRFEVLPALAASA
jgi:hypothetical protein